MVQQVEGQTVLLDIESGEYFSLNDVGKSVWDLCDGSRTVAQVADAICADYDVPPDVSDPMTPARFSKALPGRVLSSTT